MNNQIVNDAGGQDDSEKKEKRKRRQLCVMAFVLVIDIVGSTFLMLPVLPFISKYEGTTHQDAFARSLFDLFVFMTSRVIACCMAFLISFCRAEIRPEFSFDMRRPNGDKKSREELEEDALEQNFFSWLWYYVCRPAFVCEMMTFSTAMLCVVKCLCRMNVELAAGQEEEEHLHPIFWGAIAFATFMSILESVYVDAVCKTLGEIGSRDRQSENPTWMTRVSSSMSIPLLAEDALGESQADQELGRSAEDDDDNDAAPVSSDIQADAHFQAKLSDLMALCKPDSWLIAAAFVFLVLAATAQVLIPHYTGKILDALSDAFAGNNGGDEPISNVPGFKSNTVKLIIASILGGIFSGCRGSIFTVVGGRVNVRLRLRLMDSLLIQDIGFYDVTKAGDIMSRLSSDTALVGDQVTLNINVFLRSVVQAIGILGFMVSLSWQLSILAFISVPVITVLSKWYGSFVRSLTKVMQKKLADANAVSEAAITSMRTVRSFDAGPTEFEEFKLIMDRYLSLNVKSAVAYSGYATIATSLPQLVTALVIYYGGLMVRSGDISSGDLVSFLLYLQSLSDAFSSIGSIFSSLTRAVGAADKVFELIARRPRMKLPSLANSEPDTSSNPREASLVSFRRHAGTKPEFCRGEISIENVKMSYPARPNRCILDGMTLNIPPGKIVALCGTSGGGKSSILSLIQNMYQQSSGKVLIDGNEVHELSPSWLSTHVSIVSQEPTLFARSIKRNIMYGLEGTDEEPSDEDVVNVAKLANAHEFITKMPQKYETEVGDRGVQLSGGQKQRIAIARALIRKPKILLLDEATSALDAESEHMVQQSIDKMLQANRGIDGSGTTVVIVAHRLSTIRNADIIFVVKDGKLVEHGSHKELMTNSAGAYNALVKRQMEVQQQEKETNDAAPAP